MTLTYLENGQVKTRELAALAFDYICDVLVIGAGSAGIYAADAAATEGADVILCELAENIGGMSACGNVTGYYYGMNGGSFENDDAVSAKDTVFLTNGAHWEQRQIRFVERLAKSGVRILCEHSPTGLLMEEDRRVIGLLAYDGQKHVRIGAKITVDATRDGHLIRMTTVRKTYGSERDGSFVPFTVRIQYVRDGVLCSCNTDSGITDHYNALDFSEKTVLAHAAAAQLMSRGDFVSVAFQTGIREGLTFEGEERTCYEDVLFERRPEKILFWAYADFDRHGSERATDEELFQNWWVISNLSTVAVSIPIPLGCVVPKGIQGLVSAGRCFSCDTYIQSAVRMNRDMFRMGECIGVAVALACRDNVDILDIDYTEFLAVVTERCCFRGTAPSGFSFDNQYHMYLRKMKTLGRTPDPRYKNLSPYDHIRERLDFDLAKTAHHLKTDAPGVAIWSCFRSQNRTEICRWLVREMTNADSELYRFNCAIALGLLEDGRAPDVLREMVRKRDCFFFTDNRRSNQFRSAVAVCLLGRLGEVEDSALLASLLDESEYERAMYHTLSADYLYHTEPDRNFVYYTMVTHTCMALYKLYKKHGLPMRELNTLLRSFFAREENLKHITEQGVGSPAYEELCSFIRHVLSVTED